MNNKMLSVNNKMLTRMNVVVVVSVPVKNAGYQFDWNCFQDTQRTLAIWTYFMIHLFCILTYVQSFEYRYVTLKTTLNYCLKVLTIDQLNTLKYCSNYVLKIVLLFCKIMKIFAIIE